jgi:catechol 2,3-dioxygenase-like lactoylglutathione lyase family enzyme
MAQATHELQSELVDDNGARIICPTLNHTGNQTPRQQEMLNWYRNVLGQQPSLAADPPATPFSSVWTTNDNMHHRMGFFAVPGLQEKFDRTSPCVMHTAWEFETIDDLLETWERLQKLDIKPVFTVNHGISIAFYYNDPDGNLVELLTDAFGDHDRSLQFQLTSQELRANPPGAPVDPAKLLEARRGGMSLDELRERSYAGEFPPENPIQHNIPADQVVKADE